MKHELTLTTDIEQQTFELTHGTDDLAESPGRFGFFIHTGYSSQKLYFDDIDSLRILENLLMTMRQAVLTLGSNK